METQEEKKKPRVCFVISQAAAWLLVPRPFCCHSEHVTKCPRIVKADAPALSAVHPIH